MEPLVRLIRRREPSGTPPPELPRCCSAAWQPYASSKPAQTVRSTISERRSRKIVRLGLLAALCVAAALDMHASVPRPSQSLTEAATPRARIAASVMTQGPAPSTIRTNRTTAKRAPHKVPAGKGFRAYSKAEVQALIRHHAAAYGIDASLPLAIAQCESGFKWNAANPQSSARGVFQYVSGTWRTTREGRKGTSVFETEAHIKMAVAHIATIGTAAWNASRGCWDNAATALTSEVSDVFGTS